MKIGSKKLKIGIDARMFSDSFTGIGRYNFELTKRLFAQSQLDGQAVEWVIFMNDPEFSKYEFGDNVKKVRVNARHYSWREQWHFAQILRRENCDLVHFTHFNLPLLYWGKFVVTIHDTTISFFPGKKMNVWWRKWAYNLVFQKAVRASQQIITVSENTKKDVIKLYNIRPEKIQVVLNGLGDDFQLGSEREVEAVKSKYEISDTYLLYTGVWREHKNLVGLIQAFGALQGENKNLNLVITGREDPFYPEVKDTVRDLGLEPKVKFVGLVPFDELVALYQGARVFVFPSFYEGFGLPPLEAMKVNTPVCVSNSSSIPEACGDAAAYFDPHDLDDMTVQIQSVISDEARRAELIERGQEQVKKFSWDKAAEQTLGVYKGVGSL